MDKKQIVINLFSDSPEAWTAENLETLETITGESISRDTLRRAYKINNSFLYSHISKAIQEALQDARGADFDGRLHLLNTEIFPALEMLEEQRKRIESTI